MKELKRFCLRIVSPVHIGCDEVYEPTGFVIDEKEKKLVCFDSLDFVRGLEAEEKHKLAEICKKGDVSSILELYKFMHGRRVNGRSISVCAELVEHYQENLAIPANNIKMVQQELNHFVIARTAFSLATDRPYIPGSAIKGALRTAYLNRQERQMRVPHQGGKDACKKLEKALLNGGSFSTDPFRMLKVCDFMPVGEIRTKIVYVINKKKKLSKFEARGPYHILEVIEPGAVFEGTISIDKPENGSGIRTPLSYETVLEGATSFYVRQMEREVRELEGIKIQSPVVDKHGERFFLRLGRHSGAESLTIEGHRKIKIMQGRGRSTISDYGATTFWLASDSRKSDTPEGLRPFGWAVVEPMIQEIAAKVAQTEEDYRKNEELELIQRREAEAKAQREMELIRQKEEQERQQREAEEQRRKEAEARKLAEWEAMSPEDRDIARVSMPDVSDEEVGTIFNRIDSFFPENKIEVARRIKEWRIKRNMWTGQKKAQLKKVRKIKEILREV